MAGKKALYRVRNWAEYNRGLINRGNLTLWFDEEAIRGWYATAKSGRNGHPFVYSQLAVQCCLMIRSLFRLPLRATQGFMEGVVELVDLPLAVPDYTTLGRRGGSLLIDIERFRTGSPVVAVIDSSGLKVYGEGEWKMRIHGKAKRRTWRKIHLSIDATTHEIIAVTLTKSNVHDSRETAKLLPVDENIATVHADGAYDNKTSFDAIAGRGAKPIIPPRSGAVIGQASSWGMVERNRIITERWLLGEKLWKTASGYHRRSLAETGIYRYKAIFGDRLRSRAFPNQIGEAVLRAKALNRMTHCGMPVSVKVRSAEIG